MERRMQWAPSRESPRCPHHSPQAWLPFTPWVDEWDTKALSEILADASEPHRRSASTQRNHALSVPGDGSAEEREVE
jgi:hypothetical protein